MPAQNTETGKYPKNALIEDVAKDFLDGGKIKCLTEFLEFLKQNKLTPRRSSSAAWAVKYRGKTVCQLKLLVQEKTWPYSLAGCTIEDWCITHSLFIRENGIVNHEKYFHDKEMLRFVWDRIQKLMCPHNCQYSKVILGKEFRPVCCCEPFRNTNPSGAELERSKELTLIIKGYIADTAKQA